MKTLRVITLTLILGLLLPGLHTQATDTPETDPPGCSPGCVPGGQRVSVKITISSGGYMCGIHNIARSPNTDDYGASYNMPWR